MAKLPELPPNATPRVFIDYTSMLQRHTAELRLAVTAGMSDYISLYNQMAPLIAAVLPTTDSVLGGRYQDVGSTVSFPLAVTAVQGTTGGTPDPGNKPNFVSFTGRSSNGRRVRFTVFSPFAAEDNNYRDPSTGSSGFHAIFNKLKALDGVIVTKSGGNIRWNEYINLGVNSYYQRKLRRTG